jgi:putative hemolysin
MDDGSPSVPFYLFLILLLLLIGACFAAAETALASVSRIRMISAADEGDRRAKNVLYILDHFDKAITTLLIGNNLVHIACSSVATLLATKLWGSAAVAITTFVTTFLVFMASEMIPKQYAKACNERVARRFAGPLVILMRLFTPLTLMFSQLTGLVQRLMGVPEEEEPTVTEEELFDTIQQIDEEDPIDEETTKLVKSALLFTEKCAEQILVPWDRVVTVDANMTDGEVHGVIRTSHYSRLPVVKEGIVVGILQIRKFLKYYMNGANKRAHALHTLGALDRPLFIAPQTPIDELLSQMSGARRHLAIVIGPNGSPMGMITIEDILEELVGEIYDEEETGGAPA